MRRKRWLILCIACWVGALACAAGAAVTNDGQYQPVLMSEAGKPGFAVGARLSDGCGLVSWKPALEHRPPWAGQINRLGFRYTRWSDGSGELGVPLWAAAVLFGTAGFTTGLLALRPRRDASRGHCAQCGYDLRASPGRCPECGKTVPTTATAG